MLLNECASCGKENPAPVYFSHDAGGIICESCLARDQQATELDPALHQFLKQMQKQENDDHMHSLQQPDYQKLFLLLSNWFYFHNNRTLKTLNNHIQGKPYTVYEHSSEKHHKQMSNEISTIHKEE
jgi:recombinational DNA repair protein (RecF pathway)